MKQEKHDIECEIEEYRQAVMENLEASRNETAVKNIRRMAHNRLIRASEALRARQLELLDDTYVHVSN